MKLTRQHMAGIAFALLLVAVVVLRVVGGEAAVDVAERLEGAMGMALVALLYESKPPGPSVAALLLLAYGVVFAAACGGAPKPTACQVTEMACRACEAARQTYCGGEHVEVEE